MITSLIHHETHVMIEEETR